MISKRFNIKYSLPFNLFFFFAPFYKRPGIILHAHKLIQKKYFSYHLNTQVLVAAHVITFHRDSLRIFFRSFWNKKYKSNMYIKKQPKQNCTILKNMEDRWRDLQSQNWGPQHVMYLMPKTRNMSACEFEFSGINLYKSYKTRSGRRHRGSNVQCLCNRTI